MNNSFIKSCRLRAIFIPAMLVIAILAGCSSSSSSTVVIFADVHFNPFYDAAIFPELQASSEDEWAGIFAGSDVTASSAWGQETDYPLLTQALESVCGEAAGTTFAIFSGDILTHGFSSKFYQVYGSTDETAMRAFTYKTTAFFAAQVREYCGDVPVAFTLGNNDSYEGDYKIEPGGQFLADTSELFFSTLLLGNADADDFSATYTAGGYYVTNSLASDLAVISLNTILFSPDAADGSGDATLAQLAWFGETLAAARAAERRVWILLHIPPGADIYATVSNYMDDAGQLSDATMMWQDEFQQSFLESISEYSDIIDVIFSGHTHMDEYRLSNRDGESLSGAVISTPAISPLFNNNPAFKVLTVSGGGWTPNDYRSLYYPLDGSALTFGAYYTFSDAYGISGILESALVTLFPELYGNGAKHQSYIAFYYSGNSDGNPINDTNWPAYWCGIGWMEKADYLQCVNQ